MRTSFLVIPSMLLALVITAAGCQTTETIRTDSSTTSDSAAVAQANTAVLYVHGMGCPQCAYNVDLQLLKVPGVEDVKVDMGSGKATAQLSPDNPPSREQLAQAIRETGFTLVRIDMQDPLDDR